MKKLVIPIFVIAILVIAFFVVYKNSYKGTNQITITTTPSPTQAVTFTMPTATPENQNKEWRTFTDASQHVSFQYPTSLSTKYIRAQSWPPSIALSSASFSCQPHESVPGQPQITQKTIANTTYCIETITQGAAGTIYSDYSYTFVKQNRLIKLQFSIAYPQCANYPEPAKSNCQTERSTFDLDSLINSIAQTVTLQTNNVQQQKPSITSPQSNATVNSPLVITGTVPSGWMFEGVFPIKLLDSQKNIITQTQGKEVTPGSWTSGNEVAFSAKMQFKTSNTTGFIVLEKDNPSGLPEKADSFEIPVKF